MSKKGIMFNRYYLGAISEGIKTSTIRKHCSLEKGDIVTALFGGLKLDTSLEVTKVSTIALKDIDNSIAMSEGFMHADLLKEEIERIYQVEDESELFYRIEFRLCD